MVFPPVPIFHRDASTRARLLTVTDFLATQVKEVPQSRGLFDKLHSLPVSTPYRDVRLYSGANIEHRASIGPRKINRTGCRPRLEEALT